MPNKKSPARRKDAKPQLPPGEALYQTLSLCRKAGKLVTGFDAVEEAAVKGKAWIVLTAADASEKTVKRMKDAIGDLVDVLPMPLTQEALAAVSRKPVAVYAVIDRNLARLCCEKLEQCENLNHKEDVSE